MSDGSMWCEMDRRFGAASAVMQVLKKEPSHKATLSACVHSNPRLRPGALGSEQRDKVANTGGWNQAGFGLVLRHLERARSSLRGVSWGLEHPAEPAVAAARPRMDGQSQMLRESLEFRWQLFNWVQYCDQVLLFFEGVFVSNVWFILILVGADAGKYHSLIVCDVQVSHPLFSLTQSEWGKWPGNTARQ